MKIKQKSYLDQIHKLELQLRSERLKASELEQLGDMSRKQLDQVITTTEGTRKAIVRLRSSLEQRCPQLKPVEIGRIHRTDIAAQGQAEDEGDRTRPSQECATEYGNCAFFRAR